MYPTIEVKSRYMLTAADASFINVLKKNSVLGLHNLTAN